ncbi:excisionase family DNA-binding protein [Nonomuraea roseoviolacea]|uniref:Excisionase family DNA binding protein n=1 Tax=Nonomuraea roseoviolacea subsp. carminata TaxID=160689 RepID=A0ABT1K973_9ACTN|nr:excisionase family DNA-binding protein [Nonomuraea roseoviolacea]MCP2350579.1 excisionase family DNA binding protein [Nonomuraea roseoviolacea subsp. carminata]
METAETVQTAESAESTRRTGTFMSVADAAEDLDLSKEYLYKGLREEQIPGAKFGRNRKILRAFVEEFKALAERGEVIDFEQHAALWRARRDAEVAV